MKVLIFGDRGYLGTELSKYLKLKKHDVTGFDLKEGFDIRKKEHFKWLSKEFNYAIHLAGIVGDPNCDRDINNAYKTNVEGTRNVVKFCKDNDIPLIFASSCSVYGFIKSNELQDENSELHPVSFYAYTKVAGEEDIKKELNNYLILRFGTLFGWSDSMRYDLVINNLIKQGLNGERLVIYGGEQMRPFIHIYDVCRAISICLDEKLLGKTFNLVNFNMKLKNLGAKISDEVNCELFVDTKIQDHRSYNVSGQKFYEYFEPLYYINDAIDEIYKNEVSQ